MMLYRLSKGRFARDLSGKGAELAGGRWNSKGVAMLYTAESIALCTVEVAVYMPLGIVPSDYHLVHIHVPDSIFVAELKEEALAEGWQSFPHPHTTQTVGDAFVSAGEHLVLKVPSAAVQGTYNFLINPHHQDFGQIRIVKIEPFAFDERLFIKP